MNLDEFIAIYRRAFDKATPSVAKTIARKIRKEIGLMNQPVFIRDLVARTKQLEHAYGESRAHKNTHQKPAFERLKAQIKLLFDLANTDHRANFCIQNPDGSYELKQGGENTVTRLSVTLRQACVKNIFDIFVFRG